jgi:UDP-N-acetylglucosamine 2-epimerase (non-hydrolysing)
MKEPQTSTSTVAVAAMEDKPFIVACARASGGVQEEACILHVPCVTLRDNTERPETLEVESNVLAGTDPHRIVEKAGLMLDKDSHWKNPFGDGHAGEKIIRILREEFA